jgi:hypothetical protein
VTFDRLTGRQRAIVAHLAANADPDPPTVQLPSVAGHIRQVWAPNVQPGRRMRLRRWLHDTFTADLPDGGGS